MVSGNGGTFFCQLDMTICPYRLDKLRTNQFTLPESFSKDTRSNVPVRSLEF